MRVTDARAPAVPAARSEARTFGETLARIRGDPRRERPPPGSHPPKAAGGGDRAAAPAGRRSPSGAGAPGQVRGWGAQAEAAAGAAPRPAPEQRLAAPAESLTLAAAVRAIPPAIDPSRLREGQPLTLAFGTSLTVELRPGAAGVEVVLRPEARLARAARAELPGLVRALSARGVRVARCAVEPAPERSDGARPDVR